MKDLSLLIPVRNEETVIGKTISAIRNVLDGASIHYEIIIINDGSTDNTKSVLQDLCSQYSSVAYIDNPAPNGFGLAIRRGLEVFDGRNVIIVMGDGSDDPRDIVSYYQILEHEAECAFGSRFIPKAHVHDYPIHKLILNRIANTFIKLLFGITYNDTTNAFKGYRRDVIKSLTPLLSHHFNLTVELPLKVIVRGYTYKVIPINWYNRLTGISKLKIREMGGRYLFIILYLWLEKILARSDYYRADKIKEKEL